MEKALSLQQERMRSLADVDGNLVYEYTYDEPKRGAVPEQAIKMAKVALDWRQSKPLLSDAEARKQLLDGAASGAPLSDFAVSFPMAFNMVTEKQRGGEHFAMMMRLAKLASSATNQGIPIEEATAQANLLLQSHCAKSK
jgi:hypothetical protein